ncbi:MAG: argininosuccinate lyase [Ignavibacteria bacterium]|nr:argininosuccinate lyase [Ignavibacteria bacterium]
MLWGGRFKEKFNNSALKFSSSLSFDIHLIEEDIQVSKAHAEMLAKINILTKEETEKIINALNLIWVLFKEGTWNPEIEIYEDIHSAIEAKLFELIGDVAGKLHTGRSRNDQIVTDLRLWVKKSSEELITALNNLQTIFLDTAERHIDTVILGYTHLQRAQPVSFAFHLLAYIEMFERDKKRLNFIYNEADFSPLGSGALAGSTLPLDRKFTAEKLGFKSISTNAMDAVSDRDFVADFLNCGVIGMIHLSRLAEELIIWSSSEWNLIKLSDKYTTGSSLMPQKKNPDIAELIRGKTGRVFGNYITMATVLKGLPLSYNRDLQEDKEPLFDSVKTFYDSVLLAGEMIQTMQVNSERFKEELKGDFSFATDLADWLVLQGIPFRDAHHIVGEVVKYCEEKNKKFDYLNLEEFKKIHPIFDISAFEVVNTQNALSRKRTLGSPNPEFVIYEIEKWRIKLSKEN